MRLIAGLIIFALSLSACSSLNKSPETLRQNYLAITQIGTSMETAIPLIKTRISPKGLLFVRDGVPCLEKEELRRQKGTHSIKVDLGWYYWGTVETHMYGEWCFNDNKNLIDIVVYRSIENEAYNY